MKYLRHIEHGEIYDWNEQLSGHPKLEEVTEKQAYPERFVTAALLENAPSKKRGRKPLQIDSPLVEEYPPNDELNKDASRRTSTKIGLAMGGLK